MTDTPNPDPEMLAELGRMTDAQLLEVVLATLMMRRATGQDVKEGTETFTARLEPILQTCLVNMKRTKELTDKVVNLSEDLAIERASNRRMSVLMADIADVLHGNPSCYPVPLNDIVARVHKEVGR